MSQFEIFSVLTGALDRRIGERRPVVFLAVDYWANGPNPLKMNLILHYESMT
jgi:hypothetical protein